MAYDYRFFCKTLLKTICISAILTVNGFSTQSGITSKESNTYKSRGGIFEYDEQKGWWWYKEKVKGKDGKEFTIKTKFTTKEKLMFQQNQSKVKLLKQQINLLKDIKARLDYAFPDLTPKYTINKKTGERCLSNSSADCFVMPLQPDAQRVPVLAKFLRDPSPKNSEEYLRWQAKYFNELSNVSYGLRFAFLSKGAAAYPTQTTFAYGDSLAMPVSEDAYRINKLKIIDSIKDKLGIMLFVGGNTALENVTDFYKRVSQFQNDVWKNIKFSVVVPNKVMKKLVDKKIEAAKHADKRIEKFWNRVTWIVNDKLFKRFNIATTPTAIAFYKKDDGQVLWQIVESGYIIPDIVLDGTIRFLVYNNIVKPGYMAAQFNLGSMQKNIKLPNMPIDENHTRKYDDVLMYKKSESSARKGGK